MYQWNPGHKIIQEFEDAKHCYICEEPFNPHDIKHHDHCQFTGKYHGPGHQGCNVNYRDSRVISIKFYNLPVYHPYFLSKF